MLAFKRVSYDFMLNKNIFVLRLLPPDQIRITSGESIQCDTVHIHLFILSGDARFLSFFAAPF